MDGRWVDERMRALDPGAGFAAGMVRGRARLRARESAGVRPRRWRWAAAVGFASCLVAAAMPAPRAAAERLWRRLFVVEVATEPGLAPGFALTDARGNIVKLSDYRGKVVLLNFWATWCVPCRREIPWFVELEAAYADQGFAVLGVSVDEAGWDAVRPYIEERGVNYPMMVADLSELPEPYRSIQALPVTFLIDEQGRIAGRHDSLASKADYEEWISRALKMAAARRMAR